MSAEGLWVELDTRELERRFAALPGQMRTAARRAAVRTRDWLSTQLRRELAAREKLPSLALKTRFKKGTRDEPGTATLWIGLNPLAAPRAGRLSQTPRGAKAGRRLFEHAFLATMRTGHQDVFERKGRARLPIAKVRIPLQEGAGELLPKYEAPAARLFGERLEHELEFLLTSGAA